MKTGETLTNRSWERAIVIGGGMAGLFSARVLSEYYEEVLIVEKDDLPEKPDNRAGTPQAHHPHRFTPRGKMIMERFFPEFSDELLSYGAPSTLNKMIHQTNPYGSLEMPNTENDVTFSRALLEWGCRQRVKGITNVRFLTKIDVSGLLMTSDQTAVTGVHIRERGQLDQQKTLTADIVIDTSGRSSKLVKWLQHLGFDIPNPDILKVSLGYSTRHYKIPSNLPVKWDAIRIAGDPSKKTLTAVFSVIENNIAEIVLYSPGGHYPTTNADEYEQEVESLANPLIAEVLQELEPITAPRGYRVSELFRHHFEEMEQWPSGLLVLGDAFCNFDPIFGQGITMAAIEAEMLEICLREQRDLPKPNFERNVLQKMNEIVEPAWWLNCAADLPWQGVEYAGKPLKGIEFAQKYFDLYIKHATTKRNFERYGLYWAVNTLFLPLDKIMNSQMVADILASEASSEGKELLSELSKGCGQTLEEQLSQIIPSFSSTAYEHLIAQK
ncbi:FAD-dependent oxidoreductase [Metabacillus arenae]|uniref:FAD dependent oxidoreductase n=1 Tax=Metabacillus arenae TaxID=2771434 RepID=A0A926NDF2_9BACI|nr:FAD dependent oxidoreductase [Metabacillus arenae]MBD1382222.1 FAD dependent oxidoreductase [Metabacillus arenae]